MNATVQSLRWALWGIALLTVTGGPLWADDSTSPDELAFVPGDCDAVLSVRVANVYAKIGDADDAIKTWWQDVAPKGLGISPADALVQDPRPTLFPVLKRKASGDPKTQIGRTLSAIAGGAGALSAAVGEKSADDSFIDKLIDILQGTRSPDTFIVTLRLLVNSNPNPREVLPRVIRAAESRGFFSRNLFDESAAKADVTITKTVAELISQLAAGNQKPDGSKASGGDQGRAMPAKAGALSPLINERTPTAPTNRGRLP